MLAIVRWNSTFICKEGYVEVCIADDGYGFDISEQCGINQYGLSIMRERAAEIGADIKFESGLGQGTTIVLKIEERAGNEDRNRR